MCEHVAAGQNVVGNMILGFEIGGTRVRAAQAAPAGLVHLGEIETPCNGLAPFVDGLAGFLRGCEAGIAISMAGIIDPDTGRIKVANIPGIDGTCIAAELQTRLGLPVTILNDADCFALAEAKHGAGRGHRSVFGIILGTGVGGGLVLDGRVVTGAGGFAGEWGHGPVLHDPALPCGCGQTGCLDTIGGARGLERLYFYLHGAHLSAPDILAAWRSGKDMGTVARWLDLVSGPLAMVVNVVGASILPVGGGLANAPDLIAALDLALRARILRKTDMPLVVPAICGSDAGLIGAVEAGRAAFGGV
ncbi:MAG: hypothetical protein RIR95_1037 [Pseudomonadota bacterium]